MWRIDEDYNRHGDNRTSIEHVSNIYRITFNYRTSINGLLNM